MESELSMDTHEKELFNLYSDMDMDEIDAN